MIRRPTLISRDSIKIEVTYREQLAKIKPQITSFLIQKGLSRSTANSIAENLSNFFPNKTNDRDNINPQLTRKRIDNVISAIRDLEAAESGYYTLPLIRQLEWRAEDEFRINLNEIKAYFAFMQKIVSSIKRKNRKERSDVIIAKHFAFSIACAFHNSFEQKIITGKKKKGHKHRSLYDSLCDYIEENLGISIGATSRINSARFFSELRLPEKFFPVQLEV